MVRKKVDCTVIVCTYYPDWYKLRLTLKSIIMQKKCKFKIVITDDGSENNLFNEVRTYLSENNFFEYKLIANTENNGTVHNVLRGVKASEGEFIRLISPGDLLHGNYALYDWVDFMKKNDDCVMSYCDPIYYRMEDGNIIPTKEFAHPQIIGSCDLKTALKRYLIYDDICLGAATMIRRNAWMKYLEMIKDKVIYAEDNTYRIMMYCGEKIAFVPQSFLLYEYGTGVSTSKNKYWTERLLKDWFSANEIMLSITPKQEVNQLQIPKYLRFVMHNQRNKWYCRFKKWQICPSLLFYRINTKFFSRKTPIDIDVSFVKELLKS